MRYFVCGDKLMAFNGKCGTSTMAWAIVRQFYPDIEEYLRTKVKWAAGTVDEQMHHNHVPKRTHPNAPVVQVIREPVSRFRSAVAFMRLEDKGKYNIDQILDDLENETDVVQTSRGGKLVSNFHFHYQDKFRGDITYFTLSNLQGAADELGIKVPLIKINSAPTKKPDLTPEQEDRVRAFYADDVKLWEAHGDV
tara:strand:- start:69 stop:650 length:582 start_codon:yes stop_codon:yes gene_type:complete